MKVFQNIQEWRNFRREFNQSVGFVPTMGALHKGHLSLVQRANGENDSSLVSIFVNPTQFNDPKDFTNYPKTIDQDLEILEQAGTNFVLIPDAHEIYKDGYRFQIQENSFSKILCGAHRPGHFNGVLTVVMKLLNIAQANSAYFGEKDFQQLTLIKQMTETFFHPTQIVACPTVRETSGLAMSSRNTLLSDDARIKSALIYQTIKTPLLSPADCRSKLTNAGFEVEYVEDHFGRRFVAARIENVRLIDNVEI
jgi:pantoate--beta-alanine ligase